MDENKNVGEVTSTEGNRNMNEAGSIDEGRGTAEVGSVNRISQMTEPMQYIPAPGGLKTPKRQPGKLYLRMQENFGVYGKGCLIYGILYTVGLYYGISGFAFMLLNLLTIGAVALTLRHMEIALRKDAAFYFTAWALLAVFQCAGNPASCACFPHQPFL